MIDIEFTYRRHRRVKNRMYTIGTTALADCIDEQRRPYFEIENCEEYEDRTVISFHSNAAAMVAVEAAREDPTCAGYRFMTMAHP